MRIFAFFLSVMLSLEVNANSCNADQLDLIIAKFTNSPQAKDYEVTNNRLFELRYDKETRLKRPEFSFGHEVDKAEAKNSELTVELLFDVDEYLKYDVLKNVKKNELEISHFELKQEQLDRSESALNSLFQIAQGNFFLEKIENLFSTLKSSEAIYANRPIRSREDQIIINSLSMLKSNLFLKKNRLINERMQAQQNLNRLDFENCSIGYQQFIRMIDKLKIDFIKNDVSRTSTVLKHQLEVAKNSYDLEKRRFFNNLKVGPTFTRESDVFETQYRIGFLVSFDLPTFSNSSFDYIEQSKKVAEIKNARMIKDTDAEVANLASSFNEYFKTLKQLPSIESLETNLNSAKKSFGAGVISPLVYIEAYRSYVDFLEISEEMRKNIFESYLKLRGMYEDISN